MHFLFLLLPFLTPSFTADDTTDIQITINNIKSPKGNIVIGIFDNPNSFLKDGKQYKVIQKKVTGNSLSFTIKAIKKGEYAFAIYHDKNADNKCNLNCFGIPKEAYGFSKNFRPIFSKPKFKDCKINIGKERNIQIDLI